MKNDPESGSKMANAGPRNAALDVLNALDKGHRTLDRLMEDAHRSGPAFHPGDRRLFNALAFGVVRWRKRLDWIIDHFSKTPSDRVQPAVRNILRLALFQIVFMDKVPDSAAVNTAVELAKSRSPAWVVRYVNGLLRNAAARFQDVPYPDRQTDPIGAISVVQSFPRWLVERWVDRYGSDFTESLCRAMNRIPPVTLRANTLKTDRKRLLPEIADSVEHLQRTTHAPDGLRVTGPRMPIAQMTAFQQGMFQVQDEAAQLVTLLLNPRPGETVLDACAGLGGKTGHIAQVLRNTGRVFALDNSPAKLEQLEGEMKRLGVENCTVCRADLSASLEGMPVAEFDRVLLDAPCSGLGVLRRNPDAKWREEKKDLSVYRRRQSAFLGNLARHIKVGGTLLYAVCSLEPEENAEAVKDFLNRHPEFVMEERYVDVLFKIDAFLDEEALFKTFPHLHDMDGFSAARFRRIG